MNKKERLTSDRIAFDQQPFRNPPLPKGAERYVFTSNGIRTTSDEEFKLMNRSGLGELVLLGNSVQLQAKKIFGPDGEVIKRECMLSTSGERSVQQLQRDSETILIKNGFSKDG